MEYMNFYEGLRTVLMKSRRLEVDNDFDIFEILFSKESEINYSQDVLTDLLFGLHDGSEYPVFTSKLLNIIRSFEQQLGTDLYVKVLFENFNTMIPHAEYWFSLLLIDNLKLSKYKVLIENLKSIPKKSAIEIQSYLKALRNDPDWSADHEMVEVIDKLI